MARGFKYTAPKWKPITDGVVDDLTGPATDTIEEVRAGLTKELRDQVEAAGLGSRLANTWQGRRYPATRASLDAAAFVFSKAPEIIDAFDRAPTIVTVNGRRNLAIPTPNCPRIAAGRGGSRRMTPQEVETYFNQDLKFARAGNGRMFAYVDVRGTASGGFSRATGKQLGRFYRGAKDYARHAQVVMFILTPTARMPKRISPADAAEHWQAQVEPILERRLGASS
jgi:Family of unknown function (DUF6441)